MVHARKHQLVFIKNSLQQTIIVPTRTVLHPSIDVIIIRYVQDTPNNLCNRIQEQKSIQRHPIIITDSNSDYILDEIEPCEKTEFERNVGGNSDKE